MTTREELDRTASEELTTMYGCVKCKFGIKENIGVRMGYCSFPGKLQMNKDGTKCYSKRTS